MTPGLNARHIERAAMATDRDDDADRWPPFFAFCFVVGSSITLWISIAQLVRWL